MAGNKTLIIGRKGSGKSAICLMLRDSLLGEKRACLVTPDEISANEIRRFHLLGIPPQQSKQLIWHYVFTVQIAKFILEFSKRTEAHVSDVPDELTSIRRFLLDNGELDDLTTTERFWRIVERLKGSFSVEAFGVKVGAGVEHPSQGLKAKDHLDLLESKLVAIAEKLGVGESGRHFHLLLDQIEKVWSDDKESDSMVIGLLLAMTELRSKFTFLKCTLFLRTDIYEKLQFGDRDKLRGQEFHIDWDDTTLLELIYARAQASCSMNVTNDLLWKELFPREVAGLRTTVFLVNRTLMRPRDIIQLCNACRDTARTNGHRFISEEDIKQALALYSNWKLSDLQNEWSVNYPFLPDVFVLLSNSSYLFTRVWFEKLVEFIKNDLKARYPNLSASFSSDALLSVLYSIGLLGVVRNSLPFYYYQDKMERQILFSDRDFVIHPCFRQALQSVFAIKMQPFETGEYGRNVRTRIEREIRIGKQEVARGSVPARALGYTYKELQSLRSYIQNSSLPGDLIEELCSNIAAIQADLQAAMDAGDLGPGDLMEAIGRIERYIRKMQSGIEDLSLGDSQLQYAFVELIESMERFRRSGSLGEFA